jgi:hypothetical protein
MRRCEVPIGGAVGGTGGPSRIAVRQQRSLASARIAAMLFGCMPCLAYLLVLSFHPWGLATLIGVPCLVLMVIGRFDLVVTTGITTAVVMVVAAVSPHDAALLRGVALPHRGPPSARRCRRRRAQILNADGRERTCEG